jgi:uncharacterized membrane protein YkvI
MVAAGTVRVMKSIDKNYDANAKPNAKVVGITLLMCIVAFCVAQFGLLPLVAKGYSILGWLAFPVIMIPYIIHAIYTKFDAK